MRILKTEMIEHKVVDQYICDRCGTVIDDDMELQESFSIHLFGGYSSVFGDGNVVECDLCQHCLKILIGDFCRIRDGIFPEED